MSPSLPADPALLRSTYFIDGDSPAVSEFARLRSADATGPAEKAVRLFYAVRDEIPYKLFSRVRLRRDELKASSTLARENGFCLEKAVLLAAACRSSGIPCRLRFADVRNHLVTPELAKLMETDLFIYHGLVEILLGGGWVKATPAFDARFCARHGVRPIEFDGRSDAVFHEFDAARNLHMEYVKDHGCFDDLPFERITEAFKETYPNICG
jgi:transglutaminase-like putative cysteine protease